MPSFRMGRGASAEPLLGFVGKALLCPAIPCGVLRRLLETFITPSLRENASTGGVVARRDSYQYALFGIVGVVAIVALLMAVNLSLPSRQNLHGSATQQGLTTPGQTVAPGVVLHSLDPAVLDIGGMQHGIRLGDTIVAGGMAITLMRATDEGAGFLVVPQEAACGAVDAQTRYCRGASGCCGGQCVELPTCTGRADGLAATCGARPMYCCGGTLTFAPCGGAQ